MLFGTAKRLSKQEQDTIKVEIQGETVHHTTSYTYLGNQLDSTLTLSKNFEKAYNKATGRLNLLSKMRSFLNVEAAHKIYEMVIVPIILYSTLISLKLTTTQRNKLRSLDNRAKRVVGGNVSICQMESRMKKKACLVVKQCLVSDMCNNFKNYFELNEHSMRTRNCCKLLKLPKVRLEFGKKSFKFMGSKLFNNLPLSIRDCESSTHFRAELNAHFSK